VFDKNTLHVVKTLTPAPGQTAGPVAFTRDGRHALVSISEPAGAVVVYDARTFAEIKRVPLKKPSGSYNVHNNIPRSAGNSH
jgi:hypothetical protein